MNRNRLDDQSSDHLRSCVVTEQHQKKQHHSNELARYILENILNCPHDGADLQISSLLQSAPINSLSQGHPPTLTIPRIPSS